MKPRRSDESGFTLIEIIVTLTVAALLSVMLVQFMGTSISRSAEPLLSMQEGMALQGIFENMSADYKQLLLTDNNPLDTFKTRVEGGFYGTYTLIDSKYILFDTTRTETDCNTNCMILKVTISSGDHSLTSLFAR
ncbi:type II secretion system protein [uncultured Desulfosarcina sp.]|uniref:PulJ/GspJ family protein n=1 Tax=uncultured Desulfosarcina sp. TaxID=218289 RepID=UPI0029C6B4B9|nr:type II secretion system protein [uncultured Desulfosarcina sp.]